MPGVKLVRDLEESEMRLAQLAVGTAGLVLRGGIHPAELAAQITRESDLACRQGPYGPVAPNRFALRLNRRDLAGLPNPRRLARELEVATEAMSMARGRRLEGPVRVWVEADPALERGTAEVRASQRKGRRPAWALLTGRGPALEITLNRSLLGRGGQTDVEIPHHSVSRHHALIWYEEEGVWVHDLGSAGGTFVEGEPAPDATAVAPEARVTFGTVRYLLRVL